MFNKISILFVACLVSISCNPEAEPNTAFTADNIISNYYEAIGGYDNLKKVETLSKHGHYIEPAYNIIVSAQVRQKRPNYRIIGDVEVVGFEEGYNGQAWEYHQGRGLIMSEGEAKEAILVASDFDHAFIDADRKGHSITYKGLVSLKGMDAHNIQVVINVMESEYITNFYFDLQSYLLIAQRKVMPIHAVGEDVEIIVTYGDYRKVGDVLYPFSQIERNMETGDFLNATIWSKIEQNVNLPLSTFDPPSEDG